jgi:cyclophilin family peptidyl-prolyl cis-trans isomerase
MRIKALVVAVTTIFYAGALAAQTVPAQVGPPPADPENTLLLDLSTGGRVTIQLRPDVAPGHVERMKTLTRKGFYNGLTFHRVIEGFMAQGGDPKGDGTGGSDLPDLKAEFNYLPHVRGALAAARAEEVDSANSQFFIMLAPRLSLDGKYTVFGRVTGGMNYVDAIERGEPPATPSRIVRASLAADNVAPPSAAEVAAAAAAPAPAPAPAPAFQLSPTSPRAEQTAPAPAPAGGAAAAPAAAPTPGEPAPAAEAAPEAPETAAAPQ